MVILVSARVCVSGKSTPSINSSPGLDVVVSTWFFLSVDLLAKSSVKVFTELVLFAIGVSLFKSLCLPLLRCSIITRHDHLLLEGFLSSVCAVTSLMLQYHPSYNCTRCGIGAWCCQLLWGHSCMCPPHILVFGLLSTTFHGSLGICHQWIPVCFYCIDLVCL